jgi:hypothetical protein
MVISNDDPSQDGSQSFDKEKTLVPIGDFTIDIGVIDKQDLLNMRLMLPKN